MTPSINVLYEDNHLLVVNKPAGIATQGAAAGQTSLAEFAKQYLKQKYNNPGNVYLGIVSRIDALVTGALVFARTSTAAARLCEQFRDREVRKIYWAVVADRLDDSSGELVDWMRTKESHRRMKTCDESYPDKQIARLSYRTLETLPTSQGVARRLVEVTLGTGRKHQIRVQFASRNCAIIGDKKYRSDQSFSNGIALHSRKLEFEHPTTKERLSFVAELPPSWADLRIRIAQTGTQ